MMNDNDNKIKMIDDIIIWIVIMMIMQIMIIVMTLIDD